MNLKLFRKEFDRKLKEIGEELIGVVYTEDILHIIKTQGYYSTVRYNIYFSEGSGFRAELRMFGGRGQ
jgi:hypothetical protein